MVRIFPGSEHGHFPTYDREGLLVDFDKALSLAKAGETSELIRWATENHDAIRLFLAGRR